MRALFRSPDGQAALLFVFLGTATSLGALRYKLGDPGEMGPGFFPFYLGILLVAIGLLVGVNAVRSGSLEMPRFEWRAALSVSSAIAVGGLLLDHAGLAPSIIMTTIIASLAAENKNWISTIIMAVVLATVAYVIFVLGLGMRIPLVRF